MKEIIYLYLGIALGWCIFGSKHEPPQRIIPDTIMVTDTIDFCHTEDGLFNCTDAVAIK